MRFNKRALHRDFGYFYVGLIISFAFSGIFQNHRNSIESEKFNVDEKEIFATIPQDEKLITEEFAKSLGAKFGIKDKFRRFKIKDGELKISYEKTDIEFEIATFVKTPIISQTIFLHKSTSDWWIYYSDIFAISLIFIAFTGATMVPKGNLSFSQRGWKLALAGIIFPLLFLIFIA
jgi:uncharacterized protein